MKGRRGGCGSHGQDPQTFRAVAWTQEPGLRLLRGPHWNWGRWDWVGASLCQGLLFPLRPLPAPLCSFPFALSLPWRHLCTRDARLSLDCPPAGGVGLNLGALVPLPRTSLSLEPVPGVRAILFFYSSSIFTVPLPAPPATAASAWEITDTESAASSSVLLTGDFLPRRAPWWDQGPSWSLGTWGEGRKGWGRTVGGEGKVKGRRERKEEGEWGDGGKGGQRSSWEGKKIQERWKPSEGRKEEQRVGRGVRG